MKMTQALMNGVRAIGKFFYPIFAYVWREFWDHPFLFLSFVLLWNELFASFVAFLIIAFYWKLHEIKIEIEKRNKS